MDYTAFLGIIVSFTIPEIMKFLTGTIGGTGNSSSSFTAFDLSYMEMI